MRTKSIAALFAALVVIAPTRADNFKVDPNNPTIVYAGTIEVHLGELTKIVPNANKGEYTLSSTSWKSGFLIDPDAKVKITFTGVDGKTVDVKIPAAGTVLPVNSFKGGTFKIKTN